MIGCGSKDGVMALWSAERSVTVLLLHNSGKFTVENLLKTAERDGIRNKVEKHLEDEALRKRLDFPKGYGRLSTAWNGC